MNRKRVILAVLLGLLTLSLLYAYFATPRLKKAPPRIASQRVSTDVKGTRPLQTKGEQQRINFAFMTVEQKEFTGAKRDIFRFGGRQMLEKAPQASRTQVNETVAVPVSLPVPVDVVKKALSQFTFLGFLEKAGEKTVFLSSGGNLFLVKRGARFGDEQEFLVSDIDDKLLKVRHSGREGLIEIQLIEQQKLSASVSSPAHIEPVVGRVAHPEKRVFMPKKRLVRLAVPRQVESPLREMTEENNPEEEQVQESPAEGEVIEGDVNGTNQ